MNDVDVGFILTNTPYREYDAMVLFLGEKYGLIRFVLRGYFRPKAKQTSLGLEFTKVRIRFNYQENRLLSIQTGELLEVYSDKRENLDWLLRMSLASEMLTTFYDKTSHAFWNCHISKLYENLSLETLIVFTSQLIKELGIVPVVDRCVITQSTQVSDFSIEKGGFVSKEFRKNESKVNLEMLKIMRYIFGHDKIDGNRLDGNENLIEILNILVSYLEYHFEVRFNSWKLIYVV